MLFREIIAVHSQHHTKSKNTFCGQNSKILNVKVGGIMYHCALNGLFSAESVLSEVSCTIKSPDEQPAFEPPNCGE
jgi:hypothetical protein